MDDLHVFERDAQLVRHDLREGSLMPLAVRVRAGEDLHLAGGHHPDGRAFVQAGPHADVAGHLRGRQSARFDVAGKPDADESSLLPRPLLLLAELPVVGHLQRLVQRALVVAAVVLEYDGRLIGEFVRLDEIPTPELGRVDAQLMGTQFHQAFDT